MDKFCVVVVTVNGFPTVANFDTLADAAAHVASMFPSGDCNHHIASVQILPIVV